MAYQALLFDLDDTLLDFASVEETALTKVWNQFLAKHTEEGRYKEVFHRINKSLWSLVAQGKKRPEEVRIERFANLLQQLQLALQPGELAHHYENWLSEEVIWFEGAERMVRALAKRYKVGVVTNGLTFTQERKFRLGKMEEWCACFVISEKVGVSKPNQKIFHIAFEQMAISPNTTLMIGDSLESDYQGALNTGMDFCWINPKKSPLPSHLPTPKYMLPLVSHLPGILDVYA